jgi:prepilin-type N-terminal cleavage/methylation domain-containing protein
VAARRRTAFSLTELMAVVALIAVVAAVIVVRATGGSAGSRSAACEAIQGDVEIQTEIWRHNTGSWPATNLANIAGDVNYFPAGVPLCPVDGTTYTIDSSGRVVGHNH